MAMNFLHLPPVPYPQIRLVLPLFRAKALVQFLDEEYGIIDDSLPFTNAFSIKKLAGDLVRAIEDLEDQPFKRASIPDWTIPDDLPEEIEIFNGGELVWTALGFHQTLPIDAMETPKNFAIVIAALSFLIQLEDEINPEREGSFRQRIFYWLELLMSRGAIVESLLTDFHKDFCRLTIETLKNRTFQNLEDCSESSKSIIDILNALEYEEAP